MLGKKTTLPDNKDVRCVFISPDSRTVYLSTVGRNCMKLRVSQREGVLAQRERSNDPVRVSVNSRHSGREFQGMELSADDVFLFIPRMAAIPAVPLPFHPVCVLRHCISIRRSVSTRRQGLARIKLLTFSPKTRSQ